ncbi:MAG TPA: peptidylprolyl isomerase [Terriglobales bacterium]|nr:peptidylprolyl isomerase [Terriglobales bacterium]
MPGSATVITIKGLCDNPANTGNTGNSLNKDCQTLISREEFEQVLAAFDAPATPAAKHQLADAYPRMLLFYRQGKEWGLDKTPRFQEQMKLAAMQLMAKNLIGEMRKRAAQISDSDVQQYYKDHAAKFEQVEILRISVPVNKAHWGESAADPSKVDTKSDEAAMKAVAAHIRDEAIAGADFTKLQSEALKAAGVPDNGRPVTPTKVTRDEIPQTDQKVFDLKPGEVSQPLPGPGKYTIYKVVSKEMMPLSEAEKQIRSELEHERMEQAFTSLTKSVKPELNEAYFGPPEKSDNSSKPQAKSIVPAQQQKAPQGSGAPGANVSPK